MLTWKIDQRRLELKYTWKISRNSSDFKINSIITVSNGSWKGIGEAAPNIRYNETPDGLLEAFQLFLNQHPEEIHDLNELEQLLNKLVLPNALRFGIESAYIHYLCHADHTDIYTFLGIQKPGHVHTSFSLPIMDPSELEPFFTRNALDRFARLKIKVNSEGALDLIKEVNRITKQPLIIDGNETWKNPETVLQFMHELKPFNIALIEQPMPAGLDDEYLFLKPKSPYLLFADESICDHADFEQLKNQFHGINMKLMKAGGYLNGIQLLNEAVKHQMHTMVGCMIETTLGISSALHLCAGVEVVDLDGFLIVADEPFHLVREEHGVLSSTA